jgi:SAM-dependent methyltransferase
MSEAMDAEFDTIAEWTAQVAADLGPDYHVPAGCRGSGSPAALDWLIEQMGLSPGDSLLDSGAGVGGPAEYAARAASVSPVLVEPEAGACRAARTLFAHPVIQGVGSSLPLADGSFDAAWSLGVLCTTPDQLELLTELRRTVRPPGRIGLLTFVAKEPGPEDQPEGNYFPTRDELVDLVAKAGLHIEQWRSTTELPAIPDEWNERVDAVTDALTERYGHTRAWTLAEEQSRKISALLENRTVTGEMLVLSHGYAE